MANDRWLFLFIRQDISLPQQITQAGHAIYGLVNSYRPEFDTPNFVTIGVPDLNALKRVQAKLNVNQVPHYAWVEPDFDLGFTAIATIPLDEEQKKVLSNYRLYPCSPVAYRRAPDGEMQVPIPAR